MMWNIRKFMGWQVMIRGKYSQKYVIICLSPLLRYATLCYAMLHTALRREATWCRAFAGLWMDDW